MSQVRIGKAGFFNAGTGGRSTSRLQFGHSLRNSLCAIIRLTELAMLKGATPMFKRRDSVAGALLVCRVEKTNVAGLGGFNGDVGGFQVTNLTDHNNIRILT